MKLHWLSTAGLCALIFAAIILSGSEKPGSVSEGKERIEGQDGMLPQRITSFSLDRTFSFAGENLPLDNFDVRERLDRELTVNSYYHSSTLLLLKRAKRYFNIIEPILKEENVPDDFKYIAVAESALSNASSYAGAKGFWQFMESTARGYGLEVNHAIDERYHLEKSTRAACQLIKDYKERFGSWNLAAMAYNVGETNLARYILQQKAAHFYDLNLNAETMRYLFRVVALKEIMTHPEQFGYYLNEEDKYADLPQHKVITVDTTILDLATFATERGISYRQLKIYNPWLLTHNLPNRSRRTYELKIPFPL